MYLLMKQVDSPFLEEVACLDVDIQDKTLGNLAVKPQHICGTEQRSAEYAF